MQKNRISVGKVKAYQMNSGSKILGVCIPKIAEENLKLSKGMSFQVRMDIGRRELILEPIEPRKEGGT